MNALTREIVGRMARRYPKLAQRNDDDFFVKVQNEHWSVMMERYGFDLQVRSMELARVFFPEMFDEDGEFRNYDMRFAHCEIQLGNKVVRVLELKIRRDPEALMLYQWDDILPEILREIEIESNPQMDLF